MPPSRVPTLWYQCRQSWYPRSQLLQEPGSPTLTCQCQWSNLKAPAVGWDPHPAGTHRGMPIGQQVSGWCLHHTLEAGSRVSLGRDVSRHFCLLPSWTVSERGWPGGFPGRAAQEQEVCRAAREPPFCPHCY